MLLDPRTLVVAAIVANVLQAVAMGYVWYAQFRQREVARLAVGSALIAVGAALATTRPQIHPLLSHVGAITAIIAGQMIITEAIGRLVGWRLPRRLVVAVPAAVAILNAFFLFVEPRFEARIAVYSVAVAGASAISAAMLFSVPRGPLRATHWPLATVMALQAAFSAARAILVLVDPPSEELFEPTMLKTVWFIQSVVVINLIFVGLILIITQRPRLELDRQATFDSLTASLNRRAFDRLAETEWSRAVRHDLPLSVLVLDLDRFKALNDAHGHHAGDLWLATFAELCRHMLRREDLLCRSGGEEFIALLPQTGLERAVVAAERLRRAVEEIRVSHNGVDIAATVSIGVATRDDTTPDLVSTIAAADRALYRAKAAGRNRVAVDEAG